MDLVALDQQLSSGARLRRATRDTAHKVWEHLADAIAAVNVLARRWRKRLSGRSGTELAPWELVLQSGQGFDLKPLRGITDLATIGLATAAPRRHG